MKLQHTIKAVIRPGKVTGYVAECMEIPVITQGLTLASVAQNLQKAVELHVDGVNLAEPGFISNPTSLVTLELEPAYA